MSESSAVAEQATFTEEQISDAMQKLNPIGWKKGENGFWEAEPEAEEAKRARALRYLRENPPRVSVKERKARPKGLNATKGFTGDEYAFVYRAGSAFLPGTSKADRKAKGDGDSSVKSAVPVEMDWRWITEAKKDGFTEAQLSDRMQQLPPVWMKGEDGYWVPEPETDEAKFARALEDLRENPPQVSVKDRKPRLKGLYATKGFTGDEYAFVYRAGSALLPGTAKVDRNAQREAAAAEKAAAESAVAAEMDPRWIAEAEQAGFTAAQLSDRMRQLPAVWKKGENGFWEAEAEAEEATFARALEDLLENPPPPVIPRKARPKGLYATKGFTGDEYAFVYRSGASVYRSATAPGTAKVDGDGNGDGDAAGESSASAVAGVVTPSGSEKTTDQQTAAATQGEGI
jgi:hypothetical protein